MQGGQNWGYVVLLPCEKKVEGDGGKLSTVQKMSACCSITCSLHWNCLGHI